jgi:hypothetical protein
MALHVHPETSLATTRERLARLHAFFRSVELTCLKRADAPDQQHVRMFLISHLCGPFIGLALSAFLLLLGFSADIRLSGFTALVCLFWAYPAALALGAKYRLLALTSLQHLTFVIFWASHGYGGLTSPFLLWLALVPLLAFLYSAPKVRLWLILLAMLALNTGLFAAFVHFVLPPVTVDPHALRWLAALSLLSASAYVSMMAIYFGRVLNSRNEMAQEVARSRASVTALDRRATDLRHIRAAKVASLSRLVRQCRMPVDDILVSCDAALESVVGEGGQSAGSDLASIRAAAARLSALIDKIERFGFNLTAAPSAPDRA